MACCLTAPSHYLNQCRLNISKVLWHSSEDIIIRRFEDTNLYSKTEDYIFKITWRSPRGQWVKLLLKLGHGWLFTHHRKLWDVITYPCHIVSKGTDTLIVMQIFNDSHDVSWSLPTYIQEMIIPSRSKRYSIRSNEKRVLKVPKFKHDTFGKHAFAVYGLLAWNCLPKEIRLCDEIEAFNRNLKTHLYGVYGSLLLQFDFEELL